MMVFAWVLSLPIDNTTSNSTATVTNIKSTLILGHGPFSDIGIISPCILLMNPAVSNTPDERVFLV